MGCREDIESPYGTHLLYELLRITIVGGARHFELLGFIVADGARHFEALRITVAGGGRLAELLRFILAGGGRFSDLLRITIAGGGRHFAMLRFTIAGGGGHFEVLKIIIAGVLHGLSGLEPGKTDRNRKAEKEYSREYLYFSVFPHLMRDPCKSMFLLRLHGSRLKAGKTGL